MPMSEGDQRQRLAAILAADAAGYSRLMEADERATALALEAAHAVFREQVAAHHGRVINTVGDSVLAVFETAAGAVTAALAVQRTLDASSRDVADNRRLRFRIGVHLGDVNERADGDVYGDGVNIAARLQALAPPGGIVVSEAVRGAVKSRVAAAFDDLGVQAVKNIADPVRAFTVRQNGLPKPVVAAVIRQSIFDTRVGTQRLHQLQMVDKSAPHQVVSGARPQRNRGFDFGGVAVECRRAILQGSQQCHASKAGAL